MTLYRALFDLHDVCDLIRARISEIEDTLDIDAAEGSGPDSDTEAELRQWQRVLEVIHEASRRKYT